MVSRMLSKYSTTETQSQAPTFISKGQVRHHEHCCHLGRSFLCDWSYAEHCGELNGSPLSPHREQLPSHEVSLSRGTHTPESESIAAGHSRIGNFG